MELTKERRENGRFCWRMVTTTNGSNHWCWLPAHGEFNVFFLGLVVVKYSQHAFFGC
jgi:hypothetical protein